MCIQGGDEGKERREERMDDEEPEKAARQTHQGATEHLTPRVVAKVHSRHRGDWKLLKETMRHLHLLVGLYLCIDLGVRKIIHPGNDLFSY